MAVRAPVLPDVPPGVVTAGVNWATTDHAVAVVDATGTARDRFTVPASAVGLRELVRRLHRSRVGEVGRPSEPAGQLAHPVNDQGEFSVRSACSSLARPSGISTIPERWK